MEKKEEKPDFSAPTFGFGGEPSRDMQELRDYIDRKIADHFHNGSESQLVDLEDLDGLFETVTAAPTGVPSNVYDQIKIYRSGATYRLYIYDTNSNSWRYAGLT